MITIEDHCVGCDRCYHCGRDHIRVYICDKCGDYVDGELYDTEAGELCKACTLKLHEAKFYGDFDDPDSVCCDECGSNNAEDVYNYDDEWLCEDCLLGRYDKVRADD